MAFSMQIFNELRQNIDENNEPFQSVIVFCFFLSPPKIFSSGRFRFQSISPSASRRPLFSVIVSLNSTFVEASS